MKKILEKLKGYFTGRRGVGTVMTVLIIAAVVLVNAVVYTLCNVFDFYLYSPSEKIDFSLGAPRDVLAPLTESGKCVEIIFCMPEDDVESDETGEYVLKTARALEQAYPESIKLRFYNIITMVDEDGDRIDLSRYQTDPVTGDELAIYKKSVIFSSDVTFRVLTDNTYSNFYTLNSTGETALSYNGEEVMLAMCLWVLESEHPTAYFTTAHGELADPSFARLLAAAGYAIGTVDLRREDIPDDAELIVISNPQNDFERASEDSGLITEMERLRAFAESGGDLYVSLDPYLKNKLPVLEAFLAEYGIALTRTELDGVTLSHIVKDSAVAITANGITLVGEIADESIRETVEEYRDGGILISNAGALTLSGNAKPLLTSSQSANVVAGDTVVGRDGSYVLAACANKGEGEETSTLFVVPSIYLTASDALLTNAYANKEFLYSVFETVYGSSASMPYGARAILFDSGYLLEDLPMREAHTFTLILFAVPLALAVVGFVVLKKRKNR